MKKLACLLFLLATLSAAVLADLLSNPPGDGSPVRDRMGPAKQIPTSRKRPDDLSRGSELRRIIHHGDESAG